ncbi:hypothetical protein DHX103_03070 [Planococcus sp. X10-3]|uniref:hypothetical protein n=1 Tax=Planococcus sp. X10-3 TaxID=3061240 RepID=UPI003BB0213D
MEKVKIHSLILGALVISSLTMALYAYENFIDGHNGYGTVFTAICIFLIGLVVFGVIRNRKIGKEQNFES